MSMLATVPFLSSRASERHFLKHQIALATRAASALRHHGFALVYALPGIVVLAAIGANVYWMSLVMKMRHLLGRSEALVAA